MTTQTTNYEKKCLDIFALLKNMPEHKDEESSRGYFTNLKKYNISYQLANGSTAILSYVHFDVFRTEFLPDDNLWWKDLAKGEYKKIVNTLLKALRKALRKAGRED